MRIGTILLAAALAGCAASGAGGPAEGSTQLPQAGAAPLEETDAPPAAPAPSMPHWEGEYRVKVETPRACAAAVEPCASSATMMTRPLFDVELDESDPRVAAATFFVFQATWTPTTEAAKALRFSLSREGERLDLGEGTSPWRVEIPKETLQEGAEYAVDVDPGGVGVLYDQSAWITLDLVAPVE